VVRGVRVTNDLRFGTVAYGKDGPPFDALADRLRLSAGLQGNVMEVAPLPIE
jgi:hypothetical protein